MYKQTELAISRKEQPCDDDRERLVTNVQVENRSTALNTYSDYTGSECPFDVCTEGAPTAEIPQTP